MQKFTDFVLELAAKCGNVPKYLQDHKDYAPSRLLDVAAYEVSSAVEKTEEA